MTMQKLSFWLLVSIAVTLLSGLIYLVVQQNHRLSANDPQIQLSEDTAFALSNGQTFATVVPQNKVDIAQSLSPYIIIFDKSGKQVTGNGKLHNVFPQIPPGVFDYVNQHGEDRFTWQPEDGVRSAVVVTAYTHGFVLAGRSLREVEKRESQLELQVGFMWVIIMFLTLVVSVALSLNKGKK